MHCRHGLCSAWARARRTWPICEYVPRHNCECFLFLACLHAYGSFPLQGTYAAFPIVLAWIPSTFGGDTKNGIGIGVVIAISHAVGIAASYIYPRHQASQYTMGNSVSSGLMFTSAVAAGTMSLLLHKENRSRDKKYGKPEVNLSVDMGADADKSPLYRYII